jgi:hypothetical protein
MDIVRLLSKARSMLQMGQSRRFGRGFGFPLYPQKRPDAAKRQAILGPDLPIDA